MIRPDVQGNLPLMSVSEKVEYILNLTAFGLIKFGIGAFCTDYCREFPVLDIENF